MKFLFDKEKCILSYDPQFRRPSECLLCLKACPRALLMFKAKGEDHTQNPTFIIHQTFRSHGEKYCPACKKCEEVCPKGAIRIV